MSILPTHDINPNKLKQIAMVIGNGGLGDTITYIGMVNYLATKYRIVFVACMKINYEQIKLFFNNNLIIPYPIDKNDDTTMRQFDVMMRSVDEYDVYAFGHYGCNYIDYDRYIKVKDNKIINIIRNYPISYYEDVNLPVEYATKYYTVNYPKEILDIYDDLFKTYPKYVLIHQTGSNAHIDVIKHNKIDIEKLPVIDINKNLYSKGHKYYDICQKFINLRAVVYYTKLVENATSLYLIDSCIHAIALITDVSHASPRVCYQREYRMKYGFDKFDYYLLVKDTPVKIKLPLEF